MEAHFKAIHSCIINLFRKQVLLSPKWEQKWTTVSLLVRGFSLTLASAVVGGSHAPDTMGSAQQLMEQAGARGIPHAFIVDHTGTIKCGWRWFTISLRLFLILADSGHPMQPDFMQTLEQAVRDAEPKERKLPWKCLLSSPPSHHVNARWAQGHVHQGAKDYPEGQKSLNGRWVFTDWLYFETWSFWRFFLGLVEKDDLVDKVVEACSTTIYYKS